MLEDSSRKGLVFFDEDELREHVVLLLGKSWSQTRAFQLDLPIGTPMEQVLNPQWLADAMAVPPVRCERSLVPVATKTLSTWCMSEVARASCSCSF